MSPVLAVGRLVGDRVAQNVAAAVDQVTGWDIFPGGAAINIAAGVTKLGKPAYVATCVGDDTYSKELCLSLEEMGVATSHLRTVPQTETWVVQILRLPGGAAKPVGVDRTGRVYAHNQFCVEDINRVPAPAFEDPHVLVVQSSALANQAGRDAVNHAITRARAAGGAIVMDVNYRKSSWSDPHEAHRRVREFIGTVDYLKLNVDEARWLGECSKPGEIASKFEALRGVLLTRDQEGTDYWFRAQPMGRMAAFEVTQVDSTGAGDAFVGGFAYQLLALNEQQRSDSATMAQAVRFANACGAIAVTKPGAINELPTAEEVYEFMRKTPQRRVG